MHSPFPGMDPYLEASSIWPDVHTRLMNIVAEQLTPLLAPKCLAELETQVVIDRVDDDLQIVLPDVNVTSAEVSVEAPPGVAVVAPAPVQVRGRWMSPPAWSPSIYPNGRRPEGAIDGRGIGRGAARRPHPEREPSHARQAAGDLGGTGEFGHGRPQGCRIHKNLTFVI
jgi:hypothetical protein